MTGAQGTAGTVGATGPTGMTGAQGSADTAAQVLAKLITVDGAGSGLDADLLDGQSSAVFAPIASPALTGNPTAPTPTAGDNDTSIATTAFATTADNLRVLKAGDTMTGQLTLAPTGVAPILTLNKFGSGVTSLIEGRMGGTLRWAMHLGDGSSETGSASGSNFLLTAYNDAGTRINDPITISRATGLLTLSGDPTAALGVATKQYVDARNAGKAAFFAHKNGTNQTGIASSGFTKLTATTEGFDAGSYYDAANSKWTPPAGVVFLCVAATASATWAASSSLFAVNVFKNGSRILQTAAYCMGGSIGNELAACIAGFDVANGTDYYEWYCYPITSSGTATVNGGANISYFTGAWLGP